MTISLIIPARNAADTIGLTLQAIRSGTNQPDELIVVDGCSEDDTAAVASSSGAKVIPNSLRHAAGGRQTGLNEARGDIVAYTDSDCIPEPSWIQRIRERFVSDPDLAGVGGLVRLSHPRNEIQEFSASVFESIMRFPGQPTYLTRKEMPGSFVGANSCYRRQALESIGGFRSEFSNHAEDVDACWRLVDRGAKLLFDPGLKVEHFGYADSLRALVRNNVRYGFSSTKLVKYHLGRRISPELYALLMQNAWRFTLSLGRDKRAGLSCIQLGAFIAGKTASSALYGTLNL